MKTILIIIILLISFNSLYSLHQIIESGQILCKQKPLHYYVKIMGLKYVYVVKTSEELSPEYLLEKVEVYRNGRNIKLYKEGGGWIIDGYLIKVETVTRDNPINEYNPEFEEILEWIKEKMKEKAQEEENDNE